MLICPTCNIKLVIECGNECGTYLCSRCDIEYYFGTTKLIKGHAPICSNDSDSDSYSDSYSDSNSNSKSNSKSNAASSLNIIPIMDYPIIDPKT